MEPVASTAMISALVGYLAKKLKEKKSLTDFFSDFTDATVRWIRPLFLTDDEKPKEPIEDLTSAPDEKLNIEAVEIMLAKALKKDPSMEIHLKNMYDVIKDKYDNTLIFEDIKAAKDIEFHAEQEKSEAIIKGIESDQGKINIVIKQK